MPSMSSRVSLDASLSTGKPRVVQNTVCCVPGVLSFAAGTSSISTIALPLASWPVTTRRTGIVTLAVRLQRLAAGFDGLGVDQREGDDAGLRAAVDPVVHRAALHQHVAGLDV